MLSKINLLIILSILTVSTISAQDSIWGRVNNYTYDTLLPLPNATITNTTTGKSVLSDKFGNYKIGAKLKDQIIFSYINFTSDTIRVEDQIFISGYDAALIEKNLLLKSVTVFSSYKRDSLRRMEAYSKLFEKQSGITGGNTPAYGAGISLSPISYFSKSAKQQRRLKERLLHQENEEHIDYVFSPVRISQLTGLKDGELSEFLRKYRPTYEQSRQFSHEEMNMYINNKFKEYKESKIKSIEPTEAKIKNP